MKKLVGLLLIAVLVVVLIQCGRKNNELPVVVQKQGQTVKENMQEASGNIKEAASDFKATADKTAEEVGGAFKDMGARIGGAFKNAKNELEE